MEFPAIMAAATPWMNRVAMRLVREDENPQTADANVKSATPRTYTSRLPRMSASLPNGITQMVRPNTYAVVIQPNETTSPPRSLPMDGSARFTTLPSKGAIYAPKVAPPMRRASTSW